MTSRGGPERVRRVVFLALVAATVWFGALLVAGQRLDAAGRALVVPVALAPFGLILLWSHRNPPPR